MKIYKSGFAALLALLIGAVAIIWRCSVKEVGPTEPIDGTTYILYLTGRVVDKDTHSGIADAVVKIGNNIIVSTDRLGYYKAKAENIGSGYITVSAKADDYGYGTTQAYIRLNDNGASVNTIQLVKLKTPVLIGSGGGSVAVDNTEGFSDTGITLNIPNGALSQSKSISLTPFEGIDVPGLPPAGYLNIGVIHIEPDGFVLNKEATLTIPLPFTSATADSLPLMIYNTETNDWQLTGEYAVINSSNNTASAQISKFGTYSLGVAGGYEETLESSEEQDMNFLDTNKTSMEIGWKAEISYPNGIPDGVSPEWLKNAVAQNTLLEGGRISFTDSTYTRLSYTGAPPDSLTKLLKTKYAGCRYKPIYRYVIIIIREKVRYGKWTIIVINLIVKRRIIIGWYLDCRHDQGGNSAIIHKK